MRRFLTALLLFGLLVLVLDLPFRWAMRDLPDTEYDDRLHRILEDRLPARILVFGSSRAARDVMPQRITEITGSEAFSLGYPGASITFQEFVLRLVLQSAHKPHTVLLVVDDPSELIGTKTVDFRLDRSYPLAGYDVVNDEICERTGKSRLLTRLLASYRIKESLSQLWAPPKPDRFDTVFADGSMTSMMRSAALDTFSFQAAARRYAIQHESAMHRDAFLRFVQGCTDHGIRLIIVHPPGLDPPTIGFAERIAELTKGNAEIYHYDTTDQAYRDLGFYYDAPHLNRKGARVFSEELAGFLARR
ncbi:MAG: hypothetical protein IPI41_11590 [Flavobacteriales bacterium]|nr:hypothetical protein [Flavobacteriales bacterium]